MKTTQGSAGVEGLAAGVGVGLVARDVQLHARSAFSRCLQGALQVVDQVVGILEPDRQPDRARRDAGLRERRIVHAEVRGRRRMDHQRAAVADVGQVREELQRLDERRALRARALEVEAEHRAAAARQQPLRQRMARDAPSSSG